MTIRNWYSAKQGSPVPWVVLDINCWSEYREPFEWHRIDDTDVDISSGELDFTTWTQSGLRMIFVETPGGTPISGATLRGGTELTFQDAADGQLLVVMSSTQTGALQTYLQGLTPAKPSGSVLYAHLTGKDGNGDDRALFNATVHAYFGEQVV